MFKISVRYVGECGTVVVLGNPDLLGNQDILRTAIGQLWGKSVRGSLWRE